MSSTSHTAAGERPERSRNAKAQARHRAKRKAYIEQLEQTVTKLQLAAGYTQESINAMPPPLAKIRELEEENGRLQKENDELRRILHDSTTSSRISSDPILRRTNVPSYTDFRGSDRDYKRRKPDQPNGLYMNGAENHGNDAINRPPPPLTIPQPLSHHYNNVNSNTSNHNQNAPLFNLPNPGFQMPNTPSGSSATSSPPFSASVFHRCGPPPREPQIPPPLQTSLDHRPHLADHHSISNNYSQSNHYAPVKVEEDHYISSQQNSLQYSYSNGASQNQNAIDWQNGYSSERVNLQR